MYNAAQAEREAESEGLAADRLAELMGEEPIESPRQIKLCQSRGAIALGLPPVPRHLYNHTASYRRHAFLERAPMSYLVWGPPAHRRVPSTNDRPRRAATRLRRAALLIRLERESDTRFVGVAEAAKLTGLGERTLQRAFENGRIKAHRDFTPTKTNGIGRTGRWLVRVSDLRDALHDKLAKGRAIGGQVVAA